jgi:transcription elongation factor GreB
MSKAFTRETDDVPERFSPTRRVSSLPPGQKNLMTASGARLMREELKRLAEATDDAAKRRIQQLCESLQSAEVVGPPGKPWDEVKFGATVTVRDRRGSESRYRIVGVDEADPNCDWVSWLSPIARALLNARLGQRVRFRFPDGEEELEIVGITYE